MPRRYSTRKRKFPRRARKFPRRGKFARRKGMTRRSIVDLCATKKSDKQTLAVVQANGDVTSSQSIVVSVGSGSVQYLVSAASYKERVNVPNEDARNRRQVYLKGIAERMRWESNDSGNPFIVRRLCVSGAPRVDLTGGIDDPQLQQPTHITVNGVSYIGLGKGPLTLNLAEVLMQGTYGIDWRDDINATVDRRRWKVHSDKTFTIKSNNATEALFGRKCYDRINSTVTYDDEESGSNFTTSGWMSYSTQGHQQNVYIIYMVYNPNQLGGTMSPTVSVERTLYWHER
ncbi:capsid protein [Capybara genomovirus 10]|uniref:Capsid protein n=1 Tax=Capybara genomovirus 10 TaxID=2582937 RepID=A0A4P8W4T6_9VIRU|nr:capsid protein [Capybara genomovirus 10]QCS35900.1 capsid protein [Capybara genomovirus 10]